MRRYVDCDNASSTSSRAGSIPIATWEYYRKAITELYATETLQQVRHRMEQDHAFSATEQQYKRRIALWNIGKNVKSSEMNAIIAGQNDSHLVRGRRVSQSKLRRYQHRVQRQQNELQSTSSIDDKAHSILQNSTQLASPVSTTMTSEPSVPGETRCNIRFDYQQPDSMLPTSPASVHIPIYHSPSSLSRKEYKLQPPTTYIEDQDSNTDIDHNQTFSHLLDVQSSVFHFAPENPLAHYEFLDPALDAVACSNSAVEDTSIEEPSWDELMHQLIDEVMLSEHPMLQLATAWGSDVPNSPAASASGNASANHSSTPAGEATCTEESSDDKSIEAMDRWHQSQY